MQIQDNKTNERDGKPLSFAPRLGSLQRSPDAEWVLPEPEWRSCTRSLSRRTAAAIEARCRETGVSLECLLAAAWSQILACYPTAEAAPQMWVYQRNEFAKPWCAVKVPAECDATVSGFLQAVSTSLRNEARRETPEWPERNAEKIARDRLDCAFHVVLSGEASAEIISEAIRAQTAVLLSLSMNHKASLSLSYHAQYFSAEFAGILIDCLLHLLSQMVTPGCSLVSELTFLPASTSVIARERRPSAFVQDVFESRVACDPAKVAASFRNQEISYRELNERANQLARYLRTLGCGPDVIVAIHLARSIDLLIAMLGVVKAGGAFLPLDASLPPGRIDAVMEDSGAPLVITSSKLTHRFAESTAHRVTIDSLDAIWRNEATGSLDSVTSDHDLAYVIYTSGSTGTPKGVMIEHRNLAVFLDALDPVFGPEPGVMLAIASSSFDISIMELLWSLSRGFHIVLHEGDEGLPIVSGPGSVPEQIRRHGVTHMMGTPTLMRMLASDPDGAAAFGQLRVCLVGGEAFPESLAALLLDCMPGKIVNAYGPTETTVCATCYEVTSTGEAIPIGRPLKDVTVYVVDKWGRQLPPLASGELWIGGPMVGRGYLHRPELTAERFLDDPFDKEGRIYRTGDLVRFDLYGRLEFIDRLDSQVKVRGYRIELGEVEAALQRHPAVQQAVVVVRSEGNGAKSLVGYCTPSNVRALDSHKLRGFLQESLPGYMVPSALHCLREFPVTSSGKVDRVRLAQLDLSSQEKGQMENAAGVTPIDPALQKIEAVLCAWCRELLRLPQVQASDDYFAIGGESLSAARLMRKIAETYGANIRLSELVQRRTMRALAQLVAVANQDLAWSPVVPFQTDGEKPTLFLIAGLGGNILNFQFVAEALENRPVYGVEAQASGKDSEVLASVEEMARTYLEEIRRIQPHGPYHFAGYSFGGVLAFEMAQQLRSAGQEIGFLGLLDTCEWHYTRSVLGNLSPLERFQIQYGNTLKQIVFGPKRRATLSKRLKATIDNRKLAASRRSGSRIRALEASVEHRNYYALTHYKPKRYHGEIHLFSCPDSSPLRGNDPTLGWGHLAGKVNISEIAGEHEKLTAPPFAGMLGRAIDKSLDSIAAPQLVEEAA